VAPKPLKAEEILISHVTQQIPAALDTICGIRQAF
jgi:hypothetical protein